MLGIYARISKDDDSKESSLSIQNQISFGKKFAKKNGYNDIKIYSDDGISGSSKKTQYRKKFNELINDIETGLISAIWYNDQDRFERSQATRLFLKELVKKHNLLVYEGDKQVNFTDAEQVLLGDFRSIIHEYYTIIGSQKITKVKKQNAEDGKSNGVLPYGYTTDPNNRIIIDEVESIIIKDIFKEYANGKGVRSIARSFNELNIPLHKKSKALKWNEVAIWRILRNPIYKGFRKYGGNLFQNVEAIINPIEWDQAQLIFDKNKTNTGRKVTDKYILKGLLKCGVCGRNYYGRSGASPKSNYYYCSAQHELRLETCGNKGIVHYYLDELIFQLIYILSKQKEETKGIDELKAAIKSYEAKKTNLKKQSEKISKERLRLIHAITQHNLEDKDVRGEFNRMKEQDNKIQSELYEFDKLIFNTNNIIENFSIDQDKLMNTYSQKEKRELVNRYVKKIILNKTNSTTRHLVIHVDYLPNREVGINLFITTNKTKHIMFGLRMEEMFKVDKNNINIIEHPHLKTFLNFPIPSTPDFDKILRANSNKSIN